jgi:Glycosyltransferase family 87
VARNSACIPHHITAKSNQIAQRITLIPVRRRICHSSRWSQFSEGSFPVGAFQFESEIADDIQSCFATCVGPSPGANFHPMNNAPLKPVIRFFLVGMLLIHIITFWQLRGYVLAGYPDFTIFYTAGKIVRLGMWPQLYNDPLQYRIQLEFASGVHIRKGNLPYNHPPFEALLYVPFTYLSYPAAYILWGLLNALLAISVPWLLRPHLPHLPPLPPFLALAFLPVFISLLQGQDAILLMLLYVLAFLAYKRRADFAAGCWLALGLFKFHLVLPLVLILLLNRKWKVIYGFTAVGVGLVLTSLAMIGWRTALYYPHYIWFTEKVMSRDPIVPPTMPNFRGLLDSVLGWTRFPTLTNALTAVASILLILSAVRSWRASDPAEPESENLAFSLSLLVTVMVSYHTFPYDWTLLLPASLLILNHAFGPNAPRDWTRSALLWAIAILFFTPLYLILWINFAHLNLMAIVPLLLVWMLAREIRRSNVPAPPLAPAL